MKKSNLVVLALSLTFATAYAQDGQYLNSAPIDVDGYLHDEKPVTDAELESLKSTVKKYKTDNQLYKEKTKVLNKVTSEAEQIGDNAHEKIMSQVEAKKAETKALEKIKQAEAKLKCMMEGGEGCPSMQEPQSEIQELRFEQAAPVVSTAEIAQAPAVGAPFERIKLLPYAGSTSYNGEIEQLEAQIAAGLRLESNITSRFSIGIGFNYAQMNTNDFANNSQYMNTGYNNFYGQGREINFGQMGLDLYGKFFLTNGARFRPYLGAGLGYARTSMKYADDDSYFDQQNAYSYGSEEYNTSFVNGQLMIGSEVLVTEGFGFNIEAAYSTGLGNQFSSRSSKNGVTSPDQQRLRDLGEEVINSNALSIFAGVVVNF